MMSPANETTDGESRFHWYRRGMLAALSVPGLVLITSFIGFAALARETGFSFPETAFMIVTIWALPAKVVLIGGVVSGAGLPAVALAVALSSVRLMPMTVAMIPEMRVAGKPQWVLYALSHFIAVTSWVIAMERFATVPRQRRTVFYFGIGSTLMTLNVLVTGLVFATAARMPESVAAALFLLTPMYFLTSLWSSARERAGHVAMVLGLILGPVFHLIAPRFDLLAAGLSAGLLAYLAHRLWPERSIS